MKKKEKGKRKKGKGKRGTEEKEKGSDFFVNIWHTSVDNCILP